MNYNAHGEGTERPYRVTCSCKVCVGKSAWLHANTYNATTKTGATAFHGYVQLANSMLGRMQAARSFSPLAGE